MLCGMIFFDFFSVVALWFAEKAEKKNKKAQFSFYRFSLNFLHCTAPGGAAVMPDMRHCLFFSPFLCLELDAGRKRLIFPCDIIISRGAFL